MLDLSHERELSEELWHSLSSKTELPTAIRDSLWKHGNEGVMVGCHRRYARVPLHNIAIAVDGDVKHACFAKDISRNGIGVYAPINFMPKKIFALWLPHGKIIRVQVARCRRLAAHCYEVGTIYYSDSVEKLK
jgi:hypothetical protein